MDDQQLISNVYRKIEREQKLIDGANAMRLSTDNPSLQQRLDSQIREGRKNIGYLEERMRELQMRRMGQGMDNMSLGPGQDPRGGPSQGPGGPSSGPAYGVQPGGAAYPPPKDPRAYGRGSDQGDYGNPGPGGYSDLHSNPHMMPPRAPYGPPGPTAGAPKTRPNYSKLGTSHFRTSFITTAEIRL
jgi:classical protein kinase C